MKKITEDESELRITSLVMSDDKSEMIFFLHGTNVISTKQFPGLKLLMNIFGFTHIKGSADKGWVISKPDAMSRQHEHDASLRQQNICTGKIYIEKEYNG